MKIIKIAFVLCMLSLAGGLFADIFVNHLKPSTGLDGTLDIGTSSLHFNNLYINDIINAGGTVDIKPDNQTEYLELSHSGDIVMLKSIGSASADLSVTANADVFIEPAADLYLRPSGDTGQMFKVYTTSNIPHIESIGSSDFHLISTGGTFDFDDDIIQTTGGFFAADANLGTASTVGILMLGGVGARTGERSGYAIWYRSAADIAGYTFTNDNSQFVWDKTAQASDVDTGNAYIDFDDGNFWTAGDIIVDGGDIGLTADTDLIQIASNAVTINGTLDVTGNATGATPTISTHLTTKEYVDGAVAGLHIDYYLTNTVSDIADYNVMQEKATGEAESSFTSTDLGAGDDQEIFRFASANSLPFATLEEGLYDTHLHLQKTGGAPKTVNAYYKVFHRSLGGVETELMQSENSSTITSKAGFNIHAVSASATDFNSTDRLVLKIYANVSGGGAVAQIIVFMEGTTNSHLSARVETETLNALYLRQDGTKDLTGDWTVSTNNITLTSGTLTAAGFTTAGNIDLSNDTARILIGTGGLSGNLGADAILGSDGTNAFMQIESTSTTLGTNPYLTFSTVEWVAGTFTLPVISSAIPAASVFNGIFILDYGMYIKDISEDNDSLINVYDKADTSKIVSLSFNSASDYGHFTTSGTNTDLRIEPVRNLLLNPGGAGVRIGSTSAPTVALDVTGAALISTTLGVTGNLAINTNKFTVTAASGNTLVAGTLDVNGLITANGGLTLGAGDDLIGSATSDVNIGGNFTVAGATGDTVIAGTLDVTGAVTWDGAFIIGTADGIDYNPGSDQDVDLITVGVTGTPRMWWDESEDRFWLTKGLSIQAGGLVAGGDSTIVGDLAAQTVNLSGDLRVNGGDIGIAADTDLIQLTFAAVTITGAVNFAADGGANDTYAITLNPAPTAYRTGMTITFTANTANTGACTINVNSLGAKPLKSLHDQDPPDNYIESGSVVAAVYDGTNMQMIQPDANP